MTNRLRSRLLLLTLLFAVGITGFVVTAQQKSAKSKSAKPTSVAPMPVLPPLPTTGTLTPSSSITDFTFIVAGDNRPATQTATPSAITGPMITDMMQYKPAFILWTGDAIAGKDPGNAGLMKLEYQAFLGLLNTKAPGVPVFFSPGNHEMNAAGNAPCPAMQTLYQQNMVTELYGAFTYGNYSFVALDTDSLKKGANCEPPPLKLKPPKLKPPKKAPQGYDNKGFVNQAQINSLDAYLAANAKAQYIFIFMHRPMFPKSDGIGLNKASTKKLLTVFAKYKNIAYVLAAHEHLYFNRLTNNDSPPPCLPSNATMPFYLVSGGAGAPLHPDKNDEEDEKGETDPDAFYNYLVFKVSGSSVTTTLVSCGTKDDPDPNSKPCQAQPSCPSMP